MAPGMDPKHDVSVAGGCKAILTKLNRDVSLGAGTKRNNKKKVFADLFLFCCLFVFCVFFFGEGEENKSNVTEMDWHRHVQWCWLG